MITPTQDAFRPIALPFILVTLLSIAGCGGGGGGGPLGPTDRHVLHLSEVSSNCTAAPAEICTDIHVVVSSDFAERPQWKVSDSSGGPIFESVDKEKLSDNTWRFTFRPVTSLAPGTYTGNIILSTLNLLPLSYNELPESMPYKITVAPLKGNISSLAAMPGAGDWEGTNGNAAHTGSVPVSLNTAAFSRRWTWQYDSADKFNQVSPVLAANGLVYFSMNQAGVDSQDPKKTIYTNTLTALSELDSTVQWRTSQAPGIFLGAPGVSGTRLAMTDTSKVYTFDAISGAKLADAKQPQSPGVLVSGSPLTAPTLAGGNVYVGGNADLMSADASTAQNLWSSSLGLPIAASVDEWTPALTASTVYSNTAGTLRAFNRIDGKQQWNLAVPGQVLSGLNKTSLRQAPVLPDDHTVLLLNQRAPAGSSTDNSLSLVDTDSRQLRWTVNGQFTTQPVTAQGVLYVGNQATAALEARSIATGAVLWSWPLSTVKEERFGGDLIVTNNLLFIAGESGTYALDLASQKIVWSYRVGGKLALSRNGVLYIRTVTANSTGVASLTAINLR